MFDFSDSQFFKKMENSFANFQNAYEQIATD